MFATLPGRERLGELLRVETYGFPVERRGRYFFIRTVSSDGPAPYQFAIPSRIDVGSIFASKG